VIDHEPEILKCIAGSLERRRRRQFRWPGGRVLARFASSVTILVRGSDLAMSDYLVR
jgi:hypothetical protein